MLEGGGSKQIARDLGISPRTVEAHRQSVLRKLGVASVKEMLVNQRIRDVGE